MTKEHQDSPIFSIDIGLGERLKVFVDNDPQRVSFFDPDRDSWISIPRCDWERIVAAVEREFE